MPVGMQTRLISTRPGRCCGCCGCGGPVARSSTYYQDQQHYQYDQHERRQEVGKIPLNWSAGPWRWAFGGDVVDEALLEQNPEIEPMFNSR